MIRCGLLTASLKRRYGPWPVLGWAQVWRFREVTDFGPSAISECDRPTLFNFHNQTIRVIQDDQGEPWFVAADVCRCLKLKMMRNGNPNVTMALEKLGAGEMGLNQIETPGGAQKIKTVSESGLYKLIMRSDKPEAREFQDWVTREVLPSIRKDGAYVYGEPGDDDEKT